MVTPRLDFSHLTPDQRIELVEQLWERMQYYRNGGILPYVLHSLVGRKG